MWKETEWELVSFEFMSCRLIVACLKQGSLVLKVVVAHFHHRYTLRLEQCKRLKEELTGPSMLFRADHNNLVVKGEG